MRLKSTLFLTLTAVLLLSACGKPAADPTEYSSDSGLVPEQFMPADSALIMAYSNRDEAQHAALTNIEAALGDESRTEDLVTEALETQFPGSNLTYESIMGAFGEQFRLVFAAAPTESGNASTMVATLADPALMEETLETLVSEEALESKKLSKVEAFVDEENQLYIALHEDLVFVANSPETLVDMTQQEASESLWEKEVYQEALEDMGEMPLFYGLMYPSELATVQSLLPEEADDLSAMMERQMILLRAEDEGLRFDYYAKADKEKLKEIDFEFTSVPKEKPYLFEEVPSEGLMAYFESYGLQQTLMRAQEISEDSTSIDELNQTTQSYLSMDLEDEILSFMDKGYAFALHQNGEGIVPGISIYMDVSSDEDSAETLLDKLDAQVTGLLLILESALPGAVEKGAAEWAGEDIYSLTVDLSVLERAEHSPLPASVTSSEIQLMYGLVDGRLLITTASAWLEDGESVEESELYASLSGKLEGVQDGLVLVDAQGVSGFAGALRALREQLDLGVTDTSIELEELLEGFTGVIAASDTQAYESHIGGFLMLAE